MNAPISVDELGFDNASILTDEPLTCLRCGQGARLAPVWKSAHGRPVIYLKCAACAWLFKSCADCHGPVELPELAMCEPEVCAMCVVDIDHGPDAWLPDAWVTVYEREPRFAAAYQSESIATRIAAAAGGRIVRFVPVARALRYVPDPNAPSPRAVDSQRVPKAG